jgi:O-antigen biosynthesis protein
MYIVLKVINMFRRAYGIFVNSLPSYIKRWLIYGHYRRWLARYDTLRVSDREAINTHLKALPYKPVISVIMPVYNTTEKWLIMAIESVLNQLYPHLELCIADDASSEMHVRPLLESYKKKDPRIKIVFRAKNGHISEASNSALALATGEFAAFLDHDDVLREHALYTVAVELNKHPVADLIYSDEDRIDEKGRRYDPYFKPDWNPDLFRSQNYLCHLSVYRTSLIKALGGLRMGYEGSQDYDLALRVVDEVNPAHIRHIPHVLYHWRAIPGSTAVSISGKRYAVGAAIAALKSHYKRNGSDAEVVTNEIGFYRTKYPVRNPAPLVSLIIVTDKSISLLRRCIESIYKKTVYPNYEVIVVSHQPDDFNTSAYLRMLEKDGRTKVIEYGASCSYSTANNLAVKKAEGEIVCFLDGAVEVISQEWLTEMVSHALRPEIGAVGAKLYFADGSIYSGGIILGSSSIGLHAYCSASHNNEGQKGRAKLVQNVSAVTSSCLLIKKTVFNEVRGFDDDVVSKEVCVIDFCIRVIKKGYRNLWTPYAEFYHCESRRKSCSIDDAEKKGGEQKTSRIIKLHSEMLANDPNFNPNLSLDSPF